MVGGVKFYFVVDFAACGRGSESASEGEIQTYLCINYGYFD